MKTTQMSRTGGCPHKKHKKPHSCTETCLIRYGSKQKEKHQRKKRIGVGSFGEVFLSDVAMSCGRKARCAAKILHASMFNAMKKESAIQEFTKMESLCHKNIVYFIDSTKDKKLMSTDITIFMELCDGSLADIIKTWKVLRDEDRLSSEKVFNYSLRYISEILEGLVYLHEQDLIHRDMKPANVLVRNFLSNACPMGHPLQPFEVTTGTLLRRCAVCFSVGGDEEGVEEEEGSFEEGEDAKLVAEKVREREAKNFEGWVSCLQCWHDICPDCLKKIKKEEAKGERWEGEGGVGLQVIRLADFGLLTTVDRDPSLEEDENQIQEEEILISNQIDKKTKRIASGLNRSRGGDGKIRSRSSSQKQDSLHDSSKLTRTYCGTPAFLAPEIWESSKYGKRVDVWAVGCIWYEMLVGKGLFKALRERDKKFDFKIVHNLIDSDPSIPAQFRSILKKMLDPNRDTRLSAIGALEIVQEIQEQQKSFLERAFSSGGEQKKKREVKKRGKDRSGERTKIFLYVFGVLFLGLLIWYFPLIFFLVVVCVGLNVMGKKRERRK